MIYHVTVDGRTFEIEVRPDGVRVNGESVEAGLHHADGSPLGALHVDGATYPLLGTRTAKGRWRLRSRGTAVDAEVIDERTRAIREMAGAGAGPAGPRPVVAPMPGMVLRVDVAAGDHVREGQGVVIVEAMKMENELKASAGGVVSRVLVRSGDTVEKGQVLVEFTSAEAEDA
jgi:pyruvate carboxylase subunit B